VSALGRGLLRDAIAIDGDNCTAPHLLGQCQLEAAEIERGVGTLEHVSESCHDWNVYWAGRTVVDHGQSELGIRLYRQAAERGYAEAQAQLGWSYAGGRGVPRDDTLALEWYRKAAAQEPCSSRGETSAGRTRTVVASLEDPVQAVAWYRRAAEADSAFAQPRLVRMYEYGNGVEIDLAAAADWYRKGAEAHARFGILLELGDGVEKDLTEAMEWYRKAAEDGDSLGPFRQGLMYRYGTGVEENHAIGARLRRGGPRREARREPPPTSPAVSAMAATESPRAGSLRPGRDAGGRRSKRARPPVAVAAQ